MMYEPNFHRLFAEDRSWNKKCAKYGNRYGRDVVADAVSKLWA